MFRDDLGKRMKEQYEHRTSFSVPRRTYTVIRVDGKAFHTLTKGFKRPFDEDLMKIMDQTAIEMCRQIQGVCLGYVQSDEISLILTDFATPNTDAWFDGNVQKMASVSASIATAAFQQAMRDAVKDKYIDMAGDETKKFFTKDHHYKVALFDSRVFTIPDVVEVQNYLIWRQQDATRNSIQAAAQSLYSPKELHGKNTSQLQEMLFQKGINWNDYKSGEKRGRVIVKESYIRSDVETHGTGIVSAVVRSRWISWDGNEYETPIFTADTDFLKLYIPRMGGNE